MNQKRVSIKNIQNQIPVRKRKMRATNLVDVLNLFTHLIDLLQPKKS
jgi:hypothetical protein